MAGNLRFGEKFAATWASEKISRFGDGASNEVFFLAALKINLPRFTSGSVQRGQIGSRFCIFPP